MKISPRSELGRGWLVISALIASAGLLGAPCFATEIHEAATRGDQARLSRAIAADPAALDAKDTQGRTALFISLDRGRREAAITLLDAGSDWRAIGDRAVGMAVRTNIGRAVTMMINRGAPVDAPDRQGETPLLLAIRTNKIDLAKLLIEKGANPLTQRPDGTPVLCWAAATGRRQVVDLLLTSGADRAATDSRGRSAHDLALRHGHLDVVGVLGSSSSTFVEQSATGGWADWQSRELGSGEALAWHLGHCGWAIKTQSTLLVFDYFPPRQLPARPCLANGILDAKELAGQRVRIFVTHGHEDHFSPAIFALVGAVEDLAYIYGFRPGTPESSSRAPYSGPDYVYMAPRTERQLDGMQIHTLRSNDMGVGFLVTVDGVTLYHAGDHAGWREGKKQAFTEEIDFLATISTAVDIAFLNVTGCHSHGLCPLEDGTRYTLEKLGVGVWFPTHAGDREHLYRRFADRAQAGGYPAQMICPEYRGDAWLYGGRTAIEQ